MRNNMEAPRLAGRSIAGDASGLAPGVRVALLALGLTAGFAMLLDGPPLGQHEAINAQVARQMLETGDWIVPRYLNTAFLVKPPLMPWLIAAFSTLFPNDKMSGLPVTEFTARLPSMLATFATVWIVYLLARTMFGRRTAWIAGFVCATSVGSIIYAANATVEAVLTAFCTWAFAEFWWSRQAATPDKRRAHLLRFYVALGLAMCAKGPMPLSMVALPIAAWWWLDRPTRLLAANVRSAARRSVGHGVRESGSRIIQGLGRAARLGPADALSRLRSALKELGLWWGVPVFLLFFLPWMVIVAHREPHSWSLWRYEYLDRIGGQYPGCKPGESWYYVPILFGMVVPWCLSLPEALASPFLSAYRRYARPLTYAWYWVVIGTAIMSAMSFKKPYYVLPAVPGAVLLLAPVLERFFFGTHVRSVLRIKAGAAAILGFLAAGLAAGWYFARHKYADMWHGDLAWAAPLCGIIVLLGATTACLLFVRGRRPWSLCAVGITSAAACVVAWCALGPMLGDISDPMHLVEGLRKAGVPATDDLYWVSNRPDGRVPFYGGRPLLQPFDPDVLAAKYAKRGQREAQREVARQICDLLVRPKPAYIVLQRGQWDELLFWYDPKGRLLFGVDRGRPGDDDDDWVVIGPVPR